MSKNINSSKIDKKGGKSSADITIKYFKKSFSQYWDKNFLVIFLIALLIEAIAVSILAMKPVERYSEKEIKKIQEQFATFILDKKPIRERKEGTVFSGSEGEEQAEPTDSETEAEGGEEGSGSGTEGTGTGTESTGTPGGAPTSARATTSAEARRRARSEVSRKVQSKGLLGILTSSNRSTTGSGAASIFDTGGGSSDTDEDLDDLLSSVDGLQTLRGSSGAGGEEGGRGGHGQRKGGQAGIDDLISERGGLNSELMDRKGALTIESEQTDKQGRSEGMQYRSAQNIQEVLLSHNQVIKYCYERELRRYPSLKGKVVVRITINPKGEVIDVSIVDSTLQNERAERCIIARISNWKDFRSVNPEAGNVTFRQTYVFGY